MYPTLPPEINSARIEAGPGPASLIASAQAWRAVAAELEAGAAGFSATIGNLQSAWLGPSAGAMAVNAATHIAYLQQSSLTATQTAARLDLAVAAYEEVFASVVPTPLIVANRTQSAALIATNFFGQNTPAIATLATQYAEMWVQDVEAMFNYQAGSAAATSALPATTSVMADPPTLSDIVSNIDSILSDITSNPAFLVTTSELGAGMPINLLQYLATFQVAQNVGAVASDIGSGMSAGLGGVGAGGIGAGISTAPATASAVSSSMGGALTIGGRLSVPASAVTAPVRLAAQTMPIPAAAGESTDVTAAPIIMPPPPLSARGKAQRDKPDEKGYGPPIPGAIMPRTPAGG
ncbi:PPE family protein [Mycobacterium sp.]|uniref:PPE family protein n=1 Tax=Mycobacterium sp. TaxID=1785 RepID=UPI003F995B2F